MDFVDLGCVGTKYTWCNKRPGFANIRERLDRGIANIPRRMAYPNAIIQHYDITTSDQLPLVLLLDGMEQPAPKPFKFKNFWTRDHILFCSGGSGMVTRTR